MTKRSNIVLLMALGGFCLSTANAGTDETTLKAASLAATCASCHNTGGAGLDGAAVGGIAHLTPSEITQIMKAYASGERPATVMHQISKGYTDEQIELIANYLGKK